MEEVFVSMLPSEEMIQTLIPPHPENIWRTDPSGPGSSSEENIFSGFVDEGSPVIPAGE